MQLDKRMQVFIDYHINGDGECNGIVLKQWVQDNKLADEDKVDLCYMFSVTYCVESAIVLYQHRKNILANASEYANQNKNKLVFQSDRKYIKMKDSFSKCLQFWAENKKRIYDICYTPKLDLNKWIPEVKKWPCFGRFSAYLYLETVALVLGKDINNAKMDWSHGDTATSGLLNLYYYDDYADLFDKENKLREPFTDELMDALIDPVLAEIDKQGGNSNITMVETSLCAFRKFFKGSRYVGYYLDRMLEEILSMSKLYPDVSAELLRIRRRCFQTDLLGEVCGWNGIRKENKKKVEI